MHYTDVCYDLRVEIETKQCKIPDDERARMRDALTPLAQRVSGTAASALWLTVIYHPRSDVYHVEAKLEARGTSRRTDDRDAYLDSAFQRCVHKLMESVEQLGDGDEPSMPLGRDLLAQEEAQGGVLDRSVRAGDYRRFRKALSGYEEWLRKRVGRWIQRYPEAQARLGKDLAIGDLVEEVYLNAFEQFPRRSADVRFGEWLEQLIDPSLKELMRHPDEERENASLARTWRDMAAGRK